MTTCGLQFKGFTPEALQFLQEVREHNSKAWYEENKPTYRRCLLQPFQELVGDLSDSMLTIDPYFITVPAVDKTISRIYRDTRFSKDKSLYRDAMWLTFRRSSKDWTEAPAFFFELTPERYRFGMGFYDATPATMLRFRQKIDAKPEQFLKVIAFYQGENPFSLEGELYKRLLNPEQPPAIQEWYQRKSFYLSCQRPSDARLFHPELVSDLQTGFGLLAPLYHYLMEL